MQQPTHPLKNRQAKTEAPISPERILLGRLALLSRSDSHEIVEEQLAAWLEPWLSDERILLRQLALMSRYKNRAAVRRKLDEWLQSDLCDSKHDDPNDWTLGSQRNEGSDPLTLSLADLVGIDGKPIDIRTINALEEKLSAIYIRDLAKWTPQEIRGLRSIGIKQFSDLIAALDACGALAALANEGRDGPDGRRATKAGKAWREFYERGGW